MHSFKAITTTLAICVAMPASAGTVIINFEGLADGDGVSGYYSGGTSDFGAPGPNLGVSFSGVRAKPAPGAASPPNVGFTTTPNAVINTSFGFTSFSFASSFQQPGSVRVFSGTNGTGSLLGMLNGVLGGPVSFSSFAVPFAGTAHSVQLVTTPLAANFDDFRFGAVDAVASVPEPAAWAMMLGGFGLVGGALRKTSGRRHQTVSVTTS
jgi:hypothetical protein